MICPTHRHSPQKPKPSRTGTFPFHFQRSTWAAKGLAVGYGILSYLVVFLVKYLPGVLEVRVPSFDRNSDGSPFCPHSSFRLLSASLESWEGPCWELSPSECSFLGRTLGYVFLLLILAIYPSQSSGQLILFSSPGSICWHLRELNFDHVDWLRANCCQEFWLPHRLRNSQVHHDRRVPSGVDR